MLFLFTSLYFLSMYHFFVIYTETMPVNDDCSDGRNAGDEDLTSTWRTVGLVFSISSANGTPLIVTAMSLHFFFATRNESEYHNHGKIISIPLTKPAQCNGLHSDPISE